MILGILLIGIVSVFLGGCLDTTEVSNVDQIDVSEPAVVQVTPVKEPIVTPTPTLPAPKYAIGDVVGNNPDASAGCVIGSFNELGDMYSIQVVGNKEEVWVFYLKPSTKHSVKRAKLEEEYPVLLGHIDSLLDIPILKGEDAEILSKSTHHDSLGWLHIVGEVENTGIETLKFVKVIATIYNKDGTVIATDSSYTKPHTLKRGQVAPFEIVCMQDIPSGKYKLTVEWH